MASRKIEQTFHARPTIEGAGVHLKRAFGYHQVPLFDPFLMLDDFHSSNPSDYLAGFPWHPHRGIETITYVIEGLIEHGDSMFNKGTIGTGDVQWMTAGSGIIHQEMPQKTGSGRLWGMQLWANLPASHKMMPPRYRDVKAADIPEVTLDGGVKVRIVSGEINGVKGPVRDIVIEPEFFDVKIPPSMKLVHKVKEGYTIFLYVLEGEGDFGAPFKAENVILFDHKGGAIEVKAMDEGVRFVLVSGKPLGEPVAWQGPIVMNTDEELRQAFIEYEEGTFVK